MHGSGGNETDGFRRAYIIAYRSEATVRIERELGFTHSHNDTHEVLDDVGVAGERGPDQDARPTTSSGLVYGAATSSTRRLAVQVPTRPSVSKRSARA